MKRHPYILATAVATLLAIVVWLCLPKEYTAVTKVSDEYKETDLAIGLNSKNVFIRDMMGANSGMNDIIVYCKVLKTEDFARTISHKQVPGKGMTYGEYIGETDTIEIIQDHINYNVSSREATLAISFTDKDAVVASQMLDSVTAHLQQIVTDYRHEMAEAALQNAKNEMETTRQKFEQAQSAYDDFVDSHLNTSSQEVEQQERALENEASLAYNNYEEASTQYARQKALKQRAYLSFAVITDNSIPQHYSNYFLSYFLSFVLIALALTRGVKLYQKHKKEHRMTIEWGGLFSPWSITMLIWGAILGLYYLLDTDLYPITSQFYICFVLWLPIFVVCSFVTYNLLSPNSSNQRNTFDFNKSIFTFFFVISLVITPLYVYRILQIVMMFSTDDVMNNIRTLAIYGEGQGFLSYSNVINQSLFIVSLWAYPKVPMWQVVVLTFACILNSLAIMEKGTIFLVFICIMFVLFEKKVIKIRSIIVAGILLIGFFYIFNLARAEEDSDYQNNETILDFFTMYALSPPVAFCQLLPEVIPQFGTNTFEIIYLFLDRFGVNDIIVKNKLQEFVWVPVSTNVYTIFQPFYLDFGYKGVAFFSMVYGIVSGWLYRLFRNGNSIGCCIYTFIVEVLILQFYQENIFLSMVTVFQFVFFVTLFTQNKIRFSLCQKAT